MAEAQLKPEQKARVAIDEMLEAAGWVIQDYREIDRTASRGVAVREFPTETGPVDYLLFGDEKALGTIEAKKEGTLLLGVEPQTARYIEGFAQTVEERPVPYWGELPLPFHYQSTGAETHFSNWRDPIIRPRHVFHFHRPETLIRRAKEEFSLLARLRRMPAINPEGLRDCVATAIKGLEDSLHNAKPKALVNMTMGSGKTYVAVAESYRLLRHGGAERILFLVDRINLGRQAFGEFANYVTPDDKRKFTELYNVQVLRSNRIDPAAKVVITTIQRLYSILRGQSDEEFDPEAEEYSTFELGGPEDEVLPVAYRQEIPIETFDIGFIDECHRSIYGRWGQVLDYFDMFRIGLTATAENTTRIYFDQNVVTEYKHEQAVADAVNVPYTTYRIKTEVSESGGEIAAGSWVDVRDLGTRRRDRQKLEDELTYDQAKLDRAVVNPDQIRTVVRTFQEKVCTEIFPGRPEVPKTIFFCKTDNHAEDVLRIVREEFNRGSEFAKKITYKTAGSSDQHIQDFRTDPAFRIAVSVDQIATGTDIRPLECLVFMRMIGSRTLFEQMKGRGVRTIDPSDLQSVTEGATVKDRFVIVDCVGLTDEGKAWVDTRPLERKPSVALGRLLQDVATGVVTEDAVSSIGSRLARLDMSLDEKERQEFAAVADGKGMDDLAADLITSTDADTWASEAARAAGASDDERYEPTEEELERAREQVLGEATRPLMKAEVRRQILSLRERTEQLIDITNPDRVTFAGWADADEARDAAAEFEQFIKEHHDEYLAIKAYYDHPYRLRPSYEDLKELAAAIEKPPLGLTPEKLWAAYEAVDGDKVRGAGGRRTMTDLVQLIRFALHHDDELLPRKDVVMLRFDIWLTEQQSSGSEFTPEQLQWLRWMAEHIATSMTMEREDFDLEPFVQDGGLLGAHETFGDALDEVLAELNEELAAA